MNEHDKILWGFIFSLIGIAFGWTLNQFGQWLRVRQEDKKDLKLVLFNLLEVYFVFTRSDLDRYTQKVTDKLHSEIPEGQQSDELKYFIQKAISSVIAKTLKPELLIEIKTVQEGYQSSIKKLASIDPLTAYYLSGKKNINETFDTIQSIFDNLTDQHHPEPNEIKHGIQQFMGNIKNDMFQKSLTDLEKDIKKIAWKINPYQRIKSTRAINRLKSITNEQLDKDIDELITKLKPLLNGQ